MPQGLSTLSPTLPRLLPATVFPFSYEDLVALDGGEEGMDIITHILTLAPRLLNASGYGRHPHFHCVIDMSFPCLLQSRQ